jgi:hypothetical protein
MQLIHFDNKSSANDIVCSRYALDCAFASSFLSFVCGTIVLQLHNYGVCVAIASVAMGAITIITNTNPTMWCSGALFATI